MDKVYQCQIPQDFSEENIATLEMLNILVAIRAWQNDVDVKVVHVPGKSNTVADLLSRWNTTFNAQEKLTQLLPDHNF